MSLDPNVVRTLAQGAIEKGWDSSKGRLPGRIQRSARLAADDLPLGVPDDDEIRAAVIGARGLAAVLAVLAPVIMGVRTWVVSRNPNANEPAWVTVGFIVVVVIATLGYAVSVWRRSPERLWSNARRREMRRSAVREVRDHARSLAPAPLAAQAPAQAPVWFRPRMGLVSPREAEELAAEAMATLGCTGVRVTAATRDGGLDVEADGWVAEVKHHASPVPASYLHRILGVAHPRRSRTMFFTLTGYRPEAIRYAEDTGMLLFTYMPSTGDLVPHSRAARVVLEAGTVT